LIYLDTSVALAHLLAEDRLPPESLWEEELISSRLLEYELWTALHRKELAATHGDAADTLIRSLAIVELGQEVLARVREPFPLPVRTLEAIHLATIEFLLSNRVRLFLATYDERLREVATEMAIPLYESAEPEVTF
jgi:predicted nucleic acid-binding protein